VTPTADIERIVREVCAAEPEVVGLRPKIRRVERVNVTRVRERSDPAERVVLGRIAREEVIVEGHPKAATMITEDPPDAGSSGYRAAATVVDEVRRIAAGWERTSERPVAVDIGATSRHVARLSFRGGRKGWFVVEERRLVLDPELPLGPSRRAAGEPCTCAWCSGPASEPRAVTIVSVALAVLAIGLLIALRM
jgi:hypothetical protein